VLHDLIASYRTDHLAKLLIISFLSLERTANPDSVRKQIIAARRRIALRFFKLSTRNIIFGWHVAHRTGIFWLPLANGVRITNCL